MKEQNIRNFIDFRYKPLSVSQVVTRVIILWILSIACCLLGTNRHMWGIGVLIPNLLIVGIIVYILHVGIYTKTSKFIWDGTTYTCISVMLNLTAYRILAWKTAPNLLLLLSLLFVLLLSFAAACIMVFRNIKNDKYNEQKETNRKSIIPYLLSLFGFLFAKHYLDVAKNNNGIQVIAIALLLISALIAFGWTNLIRIMLYRKLDNPLP